MVGNLKKYFLRLIHDFFIPHISAQKEVLSIFISRRHWSIISISLQTNFVKTTFSEILVTIDFLCLNYEVFFPLDKALKFFAMQDNLQSQHIFASYRLPATYKTFFNKTLFESHTQWRENESSRV